MIDTIIRKIDDMNRDEGFYQALTDEEDIKFQMNTEFNNGLKKGEKRGIQKGEKKGIQKGINQSLRNTAKQMKRKNMPFDLIKEITGLDTKTIMSL